LIRHVLVNTVPATNEVAVIYGHIIHEGCLVTRDRDGSGSRGIAWQEGYTPLQSAAGVGSCRSWADQGLLGHLRHQGIIRDLRQTSGYRRVKCCLGLCGNSFRIAANGQKLQAVRAIARIDVATKIFIKYVFMSTPCTHSNRRFKPQHLFQTKTGISPVNLRWFNVFRFICLVRRSPSGQFLPVSPAGVFKRTLKIIK